MSLTNNVGFKDVIGGIKDCILPFRTDPSQFRPRQVQFLDLNAGLHCLLTATNFPIDSEVLITGFASSAMLRVLKLHGLRPVSVDLDLETMEPAVDILSLITANTKMLIVNHVFGAAISVPMTKAIPNVLILENLSSTFQYQGSALCDVKMYDIPLGGGLLHFKDTALRDRVNMKPLYYCG